jgi:predicted dehydrogenase
MTKLRWGLLGPGGISVQILNDFRLAGIRIDAVGSRSLERAKAYATEHSVDRAYGSYQELVEDPELDVIYISTPSNFHCENALQAINAGKHVLVEKPFTLNAAQATQIAEAARKNKVFAMEAMWTRFLPNHKRLFEIIESGVIGKPLHLIADHDQYLPESRVPRLYDPAQGGGSLLDLGVYPVSLAHRIFGIPERILASSVLSSNNLDQATSAIFEYSGGRQALTHCSVAVAGPVTASIMFEAGRIEMRKSFYEHSSFDVFDLSDGVIDSYAGNIEGRGMQYQALEVERCISAGLLESPIMSLDESIEIMHVLDEIRSQTGIKYPGV